MAPSTTTTRKRARPAFSPPRPKASKTSASSSTGKRRGRPPGSTNSKPPKQNSSKKQTSITPRTPSTTVSIDSSSHSSPASSPISAASLGEDEPDYILAEITATDSESAPPIPHDLIQRIMHQAYQEPDKTSIAKDAKMLVGKYVEIFVKEAIARCVHERAERDAEGGGGGDGWLEVEDLERCVGQLVLDF